LNTVIAALELQKITPDTFRNSQSLDIEGLIANNEAATLANELKCVHRWYRQQQSILYTAKITLTQLQNSLPRKRSEY
jgi:hypothetical protein